MRIDLPLQIDRMFTEWELGFVVPDGNTLTRSANTLDGTGLVN